MVTPIGLYMWCKNKRWEKVRTYLADPNVTPATKKERILQKDRLGLTCLHDACRYNAPGDVVESMINIGGGKQFLLQKSRSGLTVLHYACLSKMFGAIPLLVQKGGKDLVVMKDGKNLVMMRDGCGDTALHKLCYKVEGQPHTTICDAIRLLIESAGQELLMTKNCKGETALAVATKNGASEEIKQLLTAPLDDPAEAPVLELEHAPATAASVPSAATATSIPQRQTNQISPNQTLTRNQSQTSLSSSASSPSNASTAAIKQEEEIYDNNVTITIDISDDDNSIAIENSNNANTSAAAIKQEEGVRNYSTTTANDTSNDNNAIANVNSSNNNPNRRGSVADRLSDVMSIIEISTGNGCPGRGRQRWESKEEATTGTPRSSDR